VLSLIVILLVGSLVAFFATQNTQTTTVTLANYPLTDVPIYMIVLISLVLGIGVSWFLSLFGSISSFFTLKNKETKIKAGNREITALTKRIHTLELENERLKAEYEERDPKSM
jgi:putative membrane protein